jgi:hypothetical protein
MLVQCVYRKKPQEGTKRPERISCLILAYVSAWRFIKPTMAVVACSSAVRISDWAS